MTTTDLVTMIVALSSPSSMIMNRRPASATADSIFVTRSYLRVPQYNMKLLFFFDGNVRFSRNYDNFAILYCTYICMCKYILFIMLKE